jgi:hypothetical protein
VVSSGMLRRVALVRATRRNIPEDTILHSHRREKLKSYRSRMLGDMLHACGYRRLRQQVKLPGREQVHNAWGVYSCFHPSDTPSWPYIFYERDWTGSPPVRNSNPDAFMTRCFGPEMDYTLHKLTRTPPPPANIWLVSVRQERVCCLATGNRNTLGNNVYWSVTRCNILYRN